MLRSWKLALHTLEIIIKLPTVEPLISSGPCGTMILTIPGNLDYCFVTKVNFGKWSLHILEPHAMYNALFG